MKKIAFLASYNGSAAHAITKACLTGILNAAPILLVTNNADSNALIWARDLNIKSAVINSKNSADVDAAIADMLKDCGIDMVVCSGYMKLVGGKTIAAVGGKILNIHPALLPKFGGKGMYGSHVHKAVFAAGDKETGATIHLVSDEFDRGRILAQKIIALDDDDTPETIEQKVRAAEPEFYVETLKKILAGEIVL